jgi:hypothetical protein
MKKNISKKFGSFQAETILFPHPPYYTKKSCQNHANMGVWTSAKVA